MVIEVKVHRSNFQNAPIELKFLYSDPYDILSILKYFRIYSSSLRGHKGVKGQVYKDAPNELKINGSTSYDLVDMLKYFEIDSRSLRGHKGIKGQIFKMVQFSRNFYTVILMTF